MIKCATHKLLSIKFTFMCFCVYQVYRCVLISGRRKHQSGSNGTKKTDSTADISQDSGETQILNKSFSFECDILDLCNPPQLMETTVQFLFAPAARCPPLSLEVPPPPPPATPSRHALRLVLGVRLRERRSKETWSISTTTFMLSRWGALLSDTPSALWLQQ